MRSKMGRCRVDLFWNQMDRSGAWHLSANLRSLREFPFFRREFLQEFQVMVEETRACVNFELVEAMHSREQG